MDKILAFHGIAPGSIQAKTLTDGDRRRLKDKYYARPMTHEEAQRVINALRSVCQSRGHETMEVQRRAIRQEEKDKALIDSLRHESAGRYVELSELQASTRLNAENDKSLINALSDKHVEYCRLIGEARTESLEQRARIAELEKERAANEEQRAICQRMLESVAPNPILNLLSEPEHRDVLLELKNAARVLRRAHDELLADDLPVEPTRVNGLGMGPLNPF